MEIGTLDMSFPAAANVYLWQYSNAHHLNQILTASVDWFKEANEAFWSNWYSDVFNLDTANSFGLEVWGKVLGVKRPASKPQNFVIDNNGIFRFYNVNDKVWHAIWLQGASPSLYVETNPSPDIKYSEIPISDDMYRRCLRARLFLLYSNYSVTDINKYLNYLFPNKGVYVRDNFNMTMDIIFNYIPSDVELSVITFAGFAPKPAGVLMNYGINILNTNTFGFEENELGTWSDNRDYETEPVPDGFGTFYNL